MSGGTTRIWPYLRAHARNATTALVALAVVAGTLTTATPAVSAAEEEPALTVGGTISTTRTYAIVFPVSPYASFTYGPEAVSYTGVRTVSSSTDPDGTRRALLTADSVSIEYAALFTSSDCDGAARTEYEYSYSGSPSGLVGASDPALIGEIAVTPSGDVSYHPYHQTVVANGTFTGCGLEYKVTNGFTAGSYVGGWSPPPRGTIADTDPSPDRIAASASYGLDSLPFDPAAAPPNLASYSYTATLDLQVGEPDDNCGPEAEDSDDDGIADACEEIDAVDDNGLDDDSFVSTVYTNGMSLDVLENDIGDDIRIVSVDPVGHDEGTVNVSPGGVTWAYTNPPPGTYEFTYTIEDRYKQQDSATVTIRLDCAAENESTDQMQWTAGVDGPGRFDIDLYVLDADVTYCTEDGNITDFEVTPSINEEANDVLAFFGFDLQAGDVTYSPPRDSYPAMIVTGTVRFDMCFNPLVLLTKIGGKTIDRLVTNTVQRQLGRNLRVSGEWTQVSLQKALNDARNELLAAVAREIRRYSIVRGEVADFVIDVAVDAMRFAINDAISEVLAAAGPAGVYGMTPDEAAVWGTRKLMAHFAPQICEQLQVWEPEVELVGRPGQEPLTPSQPGSLYTNPFLVVRLTSS